VIILSDLMYICCSRGKGQFSQHHSHLSSHLQSNHTYYLHLASRPAITMFRDRSDPSLTYTLPFQLTKKIHRTVPDNLQPEDKDLHAGGKIVVITGGGTGIGAVSGRKTLPRP